MKLRKRTPCLAVAVLALCMTGNIFAGAPEPHSLTLLVVPQRFNLVQVSFDVIDRRPVALVSYKGDGETEPLVLHAWTGDRWLPIPLADYRGGEFLVQQPARIVLVGDNRLLSEELVRASDWGPLLMSINTVEADEFLNSIGRILEFSSSEWRWFARRYNMEMEDVSPRRDSISWYDQMTRARQQPPRRQLDDPPAVPIVPVPEPAELVEPEPEREPAAEPEVDVEPEPIAVPSPSPEPSSYTPVPEQDALETPAPQDEDIPVREATEWTGRETERPERNGRADEDEMRLVK